MSKCQQPPEGWECSRQEGHDGPCAAVAVPAVPASYYCTGVKHVYNGDDYFLYGSAPCPEYPTCRSEAATLKAMEDKQMDDYDGNFAGPREGTATGRMSCAGPNYSGVFTTGKRLLDEDTPAVDIMKESEIIMELVKPATAPTPLTQTFAVLGDVAEERQKQEIKWGQQNHDDLMWNAILAEEVGESAQEVLTQVWGKEAGHGHGNLREELVQVAAVAVAWIEALDRRDGQE